MDDEWYDEFGNYIGPEDNDSLSDPDLFAGNDEYGDEEVLSGSENVHQPIMETTHQQITLYHDKDYFPEAREVYGADAEILVEQEDTQPLEQPIVQPMDVHVTELFESSPPATVYETKFLTNLLDHPALCRTVAVIGHLHHGKTGLIDMLVRFTHSFEGKTTWNYTDTRLDEQARGMSIKSRPISIVIEDNQEKAFLVNFLDCPGHPDFSDEMSASLRLVDGAVLVIDAVEGVMMQTKRSIMLALQHGLPLVLVLNKLDRIITELKLPPGDCYQKIRHIIGEVNTIIESMGGEILNPANGNVIFASATHHWAFSLRSFVNTMYSEGRGRREQCHLARMLWGDIYMDPSTQKFTKSPLGERTFIELVLNPLYKIYSHSLGSGPMELEEFLQSLGLPKGLGKQVFYENPKQILRTVLKYVFNKNSAGCFSECIADIVPLSTSPSVSRSLYTGNTTSAHGIAIASSNASGPLMVHVTKMYPRSEESSKLDALGRVMSGILKPGAKVRVLREGYSKEDTEDMSVVEVGKIWLLQGRYRIELSQAVAGTIVLIEGIAESISKTATLCDINDGLASIFAPLRFDETCSPCVKVAIEPLNPSDFPVMMEYLRKISQSYPLVVTKVEDSGEHVIIGSGELYMDCVLHDLRTLYGKLEVKVCDPVVCFSETVSALSTMQCVSESTNKRNRFTAIAQPLEEGLPAYLETMPDPKVLENTVQESFNWDILAARSIWALGPESNPSNMFLNDSIPEDTDQEILGKIKGSITQGFNWASREGPLCDEPIRGVKFSLLDAQMSDQIIHLGPGQIIPAARRVCYSSFLMASPRLMEPIYRVQIQCPADCIEAITVIITRRRGYVVGEAPNPGTPLYNLDAMVPVIDSFGFQTDIRTHTQGQAFCLLCFDHWNIVPGDPLDKSIVLRPLEPAPPLALAREFMLKTRRRKGLSEDVSVNKFFDDASVLDVLQQRQAPQISSLFE